MSFPKDFLWGVSTSAAQVEGAAREDGKGLSIWDVYACIPGMVYDGSTPEVTCDEYHRLEEHVALLKKLGVKCYRFSFSWSRILPDGIGEVNEKGLAYYRKLLDLLKENGIAPVATIYHWDLPYALQLMGGFGNRECVQWFLHYAKVLFDAFGDGVAYWATFNEPIAVYVGYALGFFAPGLKNERYARRAIHHLLLCHGEAVKLFRSYHFPRAKVGIVVDVWHHYPLRADNADDAALADFNNQTAGYGMFLHPIFVGGYSKLYTEHLEKNGLMPPVEERDFETIKEPLDFFGLNFYNAIYDRAEGEVRFDGKNGGNFQQSDPSVQGIVFYDALRDVMNVLQTQYDMHLPVIITENGYSAETEEAGEDGVIDDEERIRYIHEMLTRVKALVEEGYPIKGYCYWSVMDNWEWSAGYRYHYGLAAVEKDSLALIPKRSFGYFASVIKTNGEEL